jgi:hypothetical protein
MITVVETWQLKPEVADDALRLMQEMDDLVGPNAHAHSGWCGHARFLRGHDDSARVVMLYPWRSKELHEDLLRTEESMLADFQRAYCARPREIRYYDELDVEVEHDDGHGHAASPVDGPVDGPAGGNDHG